jgi:hypothetical protein
MEEMIELYEKKGISTEDATLVVQTLAKYKEAFIDIMMVEELNLMPIDEDDSPLMGGGVTFVSFMGFGSIPLLSYLINLIPGLGMSHSTALYGSCFLTVITLFFLGAVKVSLNSHLERPMEFMTRVLLNNNRVPLLDKSGIILVSGWHSTVQLLHLWVGSLVICYNSQVFKTLLKDSSSSYSMCTPPPPPLPSQSSSLPVLSHLLIY